jgi:hypothetical protein
VLDIWEVLVQLLVKAMDCAPQDIIAQREVVQIHAIQQQAYQHPVQTVNTCVVNILLPQ